jgi:hypothetical protein
MKPRSAAAISAIGWFISALLFGFLLLSSWGLFEYGARPDRRDQRNAHLPWSPPRHQHR